MAKKTKTVVKDSKKPKSGTPLKRDVIERQLIAERSIEKDKDKADHELIVKEFSRTARASKVKNPTWDGFEAMVANVVRVRGPFPTDALDFQQRDRFLLRGEELEALNGYFDWFHFNDPHSLANNRGFLTRMRFLFSNNLFMSASIDFNWYESGLWLERFNKGQIKQGERSAARENAPPHPIIAFILSRPTKQATLAELKQGCPEVNHIHSYLHYLINKKGTLLKEGDIYKVAEK